MAKRLPIGKLAIYSLGVSSDLLAELGAGALKFIPIVFRKVGFVVANIAGFVLIEKYSTLTGAIIISAIIVGLIVLAVLLRRRKRAVVSSVRIIEPPKRNKRTATMVGGGLRARRTR